MIAQKSTTFGDSYIFHFALKTTLVYSTPLVLKRRVTVKSALALSTRCIALTTWRGCTERRFTSQCSNITTGFEIFPREGAVRSSRRHPHVAEVIEEFDFSLGRPRIGRRVDGRVGGLQALQNLFAAFDASITAEFQSYRRPWIVQIHQLRRSNALAASLKYISYCRQALLW